MGIIVGYLMIALSVFVLVTTFPGKMGVPLVPGLVPVFGMAFALAYLAAQYALTLYFRSVRGIAMVTGTAIVAGLLGWMSRSVGLVGPLEGHNTTMAQYVVCMGACVAGLVLGGALVKRWVTQGERFEWPGR